MKTQSMLRTIRQTLADLDIRLAILFGSRANGKTHAGSDAGVAVALAGEMSPARRGELVFAEFMREVERWLGRTALERDPGGGVGMRVTEKERQVLHDEARKAFGADSKVFLFGSRVDDARRGGDIDLLVEAGKMGQSLISKTNSGFWPGSSWLLGNKKSTSLLIIRIGRVA